jgi:ABC-2 type transport system permease protein
MQVRTYKRKGVCAMSATRAEPSAASVESWGPIDSIRFLGRRIATLSLVELVKLKHDRTELYTRAVQPILWLLIFGTTFTRIDLIPVEGIPYLDYLAPGIMAQSALMIAILYGIHIIWDRDQGLLAKLLTTPTPHVALVNGKAFAAGVRAISQMFVALAVSLLLGVTFIWSVPRVLGALVAIVLGAAFFSTLSMSIAGLVLSRERLMGVGQAITMPLFFASNALYPTELMPEWVQALSAINPLSYEVNALRTLLLGLPGNLVVDYAALVLACIFSIALASSLLPRLVR